MGKEIKAIPVEFDGVRFRSKLEALYAKWFNQNEVQWLYEPEAYIVKTKTEYKNFGYVPDFWLPEIKTFFEVKGPLRDRMFKPNLFAQSVETGDIYFPDKLVIVGDERGSAKYAPFHGNCKAFVARCICCNRIWFVPDWGSWKCRKCDANKGNGHFEWIGNQIPLPRML